jgi:hypothetical protein
MCNVTSSIVKMLGTTWCNVAGDGMTRLTYRNSKFDASTECMRTTGSLALSFVELKQFNHNLR